MINMISKGFSKLVCTKYFYFVFLIVLFSFLETDASGLDSLLKVNDNRRDDTIKVNRYFELSNKFRNELLDYSKAKSSANKAITLAKQINYHAGLYRGTIALAYVTRDIGNTPSAIEILHSAILYFNTHHELNSNTNLIIFQIYSYTALSELYMHLPDFKNAESCAMEALKLSERNSAGLGQCWMTLANIFYNQKNILEARKYALKAQEIFERNNSFDDLARTYSFLGNFEYMENNFPGSIKYYQLALANYRKINSLIGSRITLYNLSEIYLTIKDYKNANIYIDETLKINNEANDHIYNYYINLLKYKICFDQGDYKCAINTGKIILNIAKEQKDLNNESSSLKCLVTAYLAEHDTVNAFLMLDKLNAIKDSIYTTEIARGTLELTQKYEVNQKKNQIALLEANNKLIKWNLEKQFLKSSLLQKDNLLKNKEIYNHSISKKNLENLIVLKKKEVIKETELNKLLQNENQLIQDIVKKEIRFKWLLVFFLLFLIGFGINYFVNYRKQKRDNVKIVKQGQDLKSLMNELNHRVKNNFQMVVAMLRIQSRSLGDALSSQILNETSNRFQAIAKVHERLYQTESFSDTGLKEYLEDLIRGIAGQYLSREIKLEFSVTDHVQLKVNIETIIPIALIVNELVTNSIKYATNDAKVLRIFIQITEHNSDTYKLTYQDNGPGLPSDFGGSRNFGFTLLKLFADQLHGDILFESKDGVFISVLFKYL